jgi:hypothetical protein
MSFRAIGIELDFFEKEFPDGFVNTYSAINVPLAAQLSGSVFGG